ncbi:MAG: DUF1800 domain-containing protein [Holophagales bacterium]|nr:DUF1800 domain-containing protein [Holophagales bacterium]
MGNAAEPGQVLQSRVRSPLWRPGAVVLALVALGTAGHSRASDAPGARVAGTAAVSRGPSTADVVRFLDQATMGSTAALIAHVSAVGFERFLEEQLAAPASGYPDLPAMPGNQQVGCPEGSPTTCVRDNYTMYPLQVRFFQNALKEEDQLRQRVALALHEILVVSGVSIRQPSAMGPYLNMLHRNALGNYRTLLAELTLSPAMGDYLDMVNNPAAVPPENIPPNENYARELLQLFSVGVDMLNEDGSPQLDVMGRPVPAYEQEAIEELARVFTGWTYATLPGAGSRKSNPPNYKASMWLYRDGQGRDTTHDKGSKTILQYPGAPHSVLPANQDGAVDLDQALDNVFFHPSVGPFVSKQLIQHLVTSNPSPATIARVARVFADDGRGVRGNLAAVVRAILLDPEARGGEKSDPAYGRLREPVLFVTNLCRSLGATSDGVLAAQATAMGQTLFNPPSVFSYFPPEYAIQDGVLGPEFGIQSSTTTIGRINFVSALVFNGIGRGSPSGGTSLDLSKWSPLAADPAALVSTVDRLLLHGTMTGEAAREITAAVAAVPATNALARVRTAFALVASSSAYQVAR